MRDSAFGDQNISMHVWVLIVAKIRQTTPLRILRVEYQAAPCRAFLFGIFPKENPLLNGFIEE